MAVVIGRGGLFGFTLGILQWQSSSFAMKFITIYGGVSYVGL